MTRSFYKIIKSFSAYELNGNVKYWLTIAAWTFLMGIELRDCYAFLPDKYIFLEKGKFVQKLTCYLPCRLNKVLNIPDKTKKKKKRIWEDFLFFGVRSNILGN